MQLVFDAPVGAVEREQSLRRRLSGWQAGDQVDRFDTGLAADLARPRQPRDLRQARPIEIRHDLRRDGNLACFDPPVLFSCRVCMTQVTRWTVVDPVGV